jgi:hypothetical protein
VLRGAADDLLDTYQAERLPIARCVLADTTAQHRAFFGPDGESSALSEVSIPSAGTRDLTGLGIRYRGGPLAVDTDSTTGIRAGDRAPDAPCRWARTGVPVRLFDLFRGPHWTLLIFGEIPLNYPNHPEVRVFSIGEAEAPNSAAITDDTGSARHTYGILSAAALLIRPDGYVAWTGSAFDSYFEDFIARYVHRPATESSLNATSSMPV